MKRKNQPPEYEYVISILKSTFDKFFERYCTTLQREVPTRIFMEDNERNKILMREFRNYLEQRAQAEGWNYNPENFDVTYYPPQPFPTSEFFMANPLSNNPIVFKSFMKDVFIRLDETETKELRDGLLRLVLEQDVPDQKSK